MTTTNKPGFKLSNLALLAIIGVLGATILLDGTLYNKPPKHTAIYPLQDPNIISVRVDGEQILGFSKLDNQWLQTSPVAAPAQQQRVLPLLETNHFTNRSYALNELPVDDIFANSITLQINHAEFQFGSIEPVSKLRYVRGGDKVYLQPDTVIPLLSAANSVFIDLAITAEIEEITIGETPVNNPEAWSNLRGIGIVDTHIDYPQHRSIAIELQQNGQKNSLIAATSESGFTITRDDGFTYLLSEATAESLGLADLLLPE